MAWHVASRALNRPSHAPSPPPPQPQVGLRSTAFSKYVALQGLGFTAALSRRFPAIRDRLIADDKFLFKVVAEILIDSGARQGCVCVLGGRVLRRGRRVSGSLRGMAGPRPPSRPRVLPARHLKRAPRPRAARLSPVCATVAEVRKRGKEFWDEFEFYLSVRPGGQGGPGREGGSGGAVPVARAGAQSALGRRGRAAGAAAARGPAYAAPAPATQVTHAAASCLTGPPLLPLQDLIVGVVLDVALVSLIAPRAVLGAKPAAVTGGRELARR